MDTYAERLARAMHKKGLNQSELARRIGVKPQAIQHLLSPKKNASGSKFTTAIALACDVPAIWLENGPGGIDDLARQQRVNVEPGPDIRGRVPMISWVQAGEWNPAADPYHPCDADTWLACPVAHGLSTYALRVRGDSMTSQHGRSYPDGSIIFVDPDRCCPTNGDRIIAKLEGTDEVTFKMFAQDAGRVFLRAINPAYPPIMEPFKVLGTVIGAWID